MPNYQLGKIYKIVDNTNNNIYAGSTTEPSLARRLSGHVRNFRQWKNGKHTNISSFRIIENNDYDIVLIENCPCETKDELHKRERHYIETLECVNRYIVGRTHKEYYETNKDKINEHKKKYYFENRDYFIEQKKKYYEENKEKLNEQKNRACICECGKQVTNNHNARHKKSIIHQDFISSLQNKV